MCLLFRKYANALSVEHGKLRLLREYTEYDYKTELVAVIGKTARHVSAEGALGYMFSFTFGTTFPSVTGGYYPRALLGSICKPSIRQNSGSYSAVCSIFP